MGVRPTHSEDRLPTQILKGLLRRIFVGELKPGDRLPPLRELAEQLGVDRTSLRIALEQLRRMNVLSIVQGSGMVVLDFRTHAGLEFYNAVFASDDAPEPDPSLLLQVLEYQSMTVPGLLAVAASRVTPEAGRALEALYLRILAQPADLETAAALAVEGQDLIARAAGNVVVLAAYNSTRPLRRRLMLHVLRSVDVRAHFTRQLDLARRFMLGAISVEEIRATYEAYQNSFTSQARASLIAQLRASSAALTGTAS